MIVLALRTLGGTWEQWEDDLTVPRIRAMLKSLKRAPPVDTIALGVAVGLGVMKLPEDDEDTPVRVSSSRRPSQKHVAVGPLNSKITTTHGLDFLSVFGTTGSFGKMN